MATVRVRMKVFPTWGRCADLVFCNHADRRFRFHGFISGVYSSPYALKPVPGPGATLVTCRCWGYLIFLRKSSWVHGRSRMNPIPEQGNLVWSLSWRGLLLCEQNF